MLNRFLIKCRAELTEINDISYHSHLFFALFWLPILPLMAMSINMAVIIFAAIVCGYANVLRTKEFHNKLKQMPLSAFALLFFAIICTASVLTALATWELPTSSLSNLSLKSIAIFYLYWICLYPTFFLIKIANIHTAIE